MSHLSGTLVISLFAARNLPPMNSNGKCDAFVQFQCGPNKLKSKVVKSLNPVFNERFSFKYEPKHGHISLGLYDEGFMSNTLIGETFIDWFPLVTRCGKPPGELDMEITFQCPGAPPSQHPAPAPAAQSQPPVAPPPAPAPAAPAPAPAPAAPAPMPTPIVAQTVVTSPTPVVATYVVPQPQPQPRPSAAQVTPCGTIVPQQIGGPAPQQPMMVMPMQQPPMSMQQPPMPMQQPSMPMQQPPMQMGMATTPMQMGVNVGMPGGMGMGMSVAQPGMMGMPSMGMQVGMQQPMGMMGGFQPTGMMDPSMGGMAVGMSAQPSVSVNFGMPSQQGMMPQQGFQGGYGYGY